MAESTGGTRRQEPNEAKKDSEIRDPDATSKETLSDIQDGEKESGSGDADRDPGPSPDGLLDAPDEIKDAGPM